MFASTNARVRQQSYNTFTNPAIQSRNQQYNFNSVLGLNHHREDPQLVPRAGERSLTKALLVLHGICMLVLVLAGKELIFFIVANMRLCFGFVLEAVLIIQGCFRYS